MAQHEGIMVTQPCPGEWRVNWSKATYRLVDKDEVSLLLQSACACNHIAGSDLELFHKGIIRIYYNPVDWHHQSASSIVDRVIELIERNKVDRGPTLADEDLDALEASLDALIDELVGIAHPGFTLYEGGTADE